MGKFETHLRILCIENTIDFCVFVGNLIEQNYD